MMRTFADEAADCAREEHAAAVMVAVQSNLIERPLQDIRHTGRLKIVDQLISVITRHDDQQVDDRAND
ncbi:MAG: hypothetical protein ABF868_12095 [Sporolactobacillus sp.]